MKLTVANYRIGTGSLAAAAAACNQFFMSCLV